MIYSFPCPETDNIGGCNAFMFVDVDNVLSIPPESISGVENPIVLKEGTSFLNGYASHGSLEFSQKIRENNAGKYFLTEITGFYPKLSKPMFDLFSKMSLLRFIIIVTDNNGFTHRAGNLETPLEFNFDTSPGKNPSSRNGFKFSFTGRLTGTSPLF